MRKKNMVTYEELSKPLAPWTPKWLKWEVASLLLKTVGRLSDGVKIGYNCGFDSGVMLDYVYQNRPHGDFLLGCLIDYLYLNGPGWSGIRDRKKILKTFLTELILKNRLYKVDTTILDIAGGPGRYLLETLSDIGEEKVFIISRDINNEQLEKGNLLQKEFEIKNIRYEQADAFSPKDMVSVEPKPNIIITSGLYELFTNDFMIRRSMRLIHKTLKAGGYFIFTNQPYHPQLELIGRVLPNRNGERWVMKLRSDETVKRWAESIGFKVLKSVTEPRGIFSVILCQKIDPNT